MMFSTEESATEIPKVLLVDDDEGNLLALSIALRDIPCEVIRCNAGPVALDYLTEREVAVVFLDVRMPGMDGFEVAKRAREIAKVGSTPIIFVTGSEPTPAYIDRMFDAGGTDYLIMRLNLKICRINEIFFV
jgi:CheY-like chemotaxis protein